MESKLNNVGESTNAWAQSTNVKCNFVDSCDSTNDWAKGETCEEPFQLLLCNHQNKGRGRSENQWQDTKNGGSLLSSWCFHLNQPPQHITSPLFGLAVYESAKFSWPSLEWSLKAPNDLYLSDKKVGGLLIEVIQQGTISKLIVGFGLNVLTAPEEVSNACYIAGENGTGGEISEEKWNHFLTTLQNHLKNACKDCLAPELTSEHRVRLVEALNFNPHRPGTILEISGDGDIVMEKQTLKWTDL